MDAAIFAVLGWVYAQSTACLQQRRRILRVVCKEIRQWIGIGLKDVPVPHKTSSAFKKTSAQVVVSWNTTSGAEIRTQHSCTTHWIECSQLYWEWCAGYENWPDRETVTQLSHTISDIFTKHWANKHDLPTWYSLYIAINVQRLNLMAQRLKFQERGTMIYLTLT